MGKIEKILNHNSWIKIQMIRCSMGEYITRFFYPIEKRIKKELLIKTKEDEVIRNKSGYLITNRPGKKFKYCIVRMAWDQIGDVLTCGVKYAFIYHYLKTQGLIPLLDIEFGYVFEQKKLDIENLWTIVFEQESISEVCKYENCIVLPVGVHFVSQKECLRLNGKMSDPAIHGMTENWEHYYKVAHSIIQDSFRFKAEYKYDVDVFLNNIQVSEGKPLCGVAMRESFTEDYYNNLTNEKNKKTYLNHPLTYSIEKCIRISNEKNSEWGNNNFLIATRHSDTIARFRELVNNKVYCLERNRTVFSSVIKKKIVNEHLEEYSAKDLYVCLNNNENSQTRQERIVGYVKEIYALSQCDYLIGSKSGGLSVALAMNGGKYNNLYVFPDRNTIERY